MKLILQKDVKNLGKAGDQVSVKKGFARNFLIPRGHALLLNKDRLKAWNHQKVIISAKKRKAISARKALIEKLSSIQLTFERESQKDNRIFGSVTAHEISQALEETHNISIDKRDIHFSELKTVGNHKVSIRLDSEQETEILLTIKGKIRKKKDSSVKTTPKIEGIEEQAKESSQKPLTGSQAELEQKDQAKDQTKEMEEQTKEFMQKSGTSSRAEKNQVQDKTKGAEEQTKEFSQKPVTSSQAEKDQAIDKTEDAEEQTTESSQKPLKSSPAELGKTDWTKDSKDRTQKSKASEATQKQEGQGMQVKKQEKSKLKEESKDKAQKLKDSSQNKVKTKEKSKKSSGLLKKLFGKKR